MPFKVGDRVKAVGFVDGLDMSGKTGVVKIVVVRAHFPIGVEFDLPFGSGHELYYERASYARHDRGRWGEEQDFVLTTARQRETKDRHVFRPGDRVVKVQDEGSFCTRTNLPVGATGTVFWADVRQGHFPHMMVLLDDKYKGAHTTHGGMCEYFDFGFYHVPTTMNRHELQRYHVCPREHFKYVGRRINPEKIHEYR